MGNLTEKEVTALEDLLSNEDLLVKKFNMLAQNATDEGIKTKLQSIASKHQQHFNTLYGKL